MNRFLLLPLLFICVQQSTFCQNNIPCGYDYYVQSLSKTNHNIYKGIQKPYDRITESASLRGDIYEIDVVVHIVYQDSSQNLPDSTINNVIDVLNKDYRRQNVDTFKLRQRFRDRVGDPGIEFNLAGIERVQTDTTFELNILQGSLPDNVKTVEGGGSAAWDTKKFMNIWVCNIEGGSLLGYAYPPGGLENWPDDSEAPESDLDGVVIHSAVFKSSGIFESTGQLGDTIRVDIRGRTVTHEVGHYLGLRHIWGDGLLAIFGVPDCDADDGLEDTPNQGLNSGFACDTMANTCTDNENDMPDMIENYMDYASESCMVSFTNDQIGIMRSVLENERKTLLGPVSTEYVNAKEISLKVFPNPFDESLTITNPASNSVLCRVIDVNGQVVKDFELNSLESKIIKEFQNWNPGIYFLNYLNAGESKTIKLIRTKS